ncbi:NifB/NifX family molybdenum-iron cluster-binding protein [Eubacteriales bacterium KG127]
MARPQKFREVGSMPNSDGLYPMGYNNDAMKNKIVLSIEEYEVLRLIDYLGLTQNQCADSMRVSRSTIANIYEKARFKLADALINEKPLLIGGGNYVISRENIKIAKYTEVKKMKIATTYENGKIYQHFGHTKQFKIYEVENKEIKSTEILNTAGSGHGALAGFLKEAGVEILICGGIGGGAKSALSEAGIKLYGGVTGMSDSAVESLLKDTLEYNANVTCSHHSDGHHSCGNHGSGEGHHNCGHHSSEGKHHHCKK